MTTSPAPAITLADDDLDLIVSALSAAASDPTASPTTLILAGLASSALVAAIDSATA